MTQTTKKQLEELVKRQFETMAELAEEIRRLNSNGQPEQALKLAKILDKLSKDSLAIGNTIRDRAA